MMVNDLTYQYPDTKNPVFVGLNAQFQPGQLAAITGMNGSGKSTFINAIRNVTRKDVGYALTGSKETTQNPTKYEHPNLKTISLWDMPGIGGKEWDTERYKEEICLKKYDVLINQEFWKSLAKNSFYIRNFM